MMTREQRQERPFAMNPTTKNQAAKYALLVAGSLSFAVAVFQAIIGFSPSWSLHFGAPEDLTANPVLLLIAGLTAAALFVVFGLYGFSGAGIVRRLPLLRLGLSVIAGIYVVRGLLVVPLVLVKAGLLSPWGSIPEPAMPSSLVSFLIGVTYVVGLALEWTRLGSPTEPDRGSAP